MPQSPRARSTTITITIISVIAEWVLVREGLLKFAPPTLPAGVRSLMNLCTRDRTILAQPVSQAVASGA